MNTLKNNSATKNQTITWLIAFVAFFSFTLGIWNQPFIDFEARFALFAKEMLRNGVTLFPTTYGQPYPDYPVTSTLLIYLFANLLGVFNKFVAVLPTALAATGVITLSYTLLAKHSRMWALATICFEWMTFTFLSESRSISLDQMMAFICLCSFYVLHTGQQRSERANSALILLLLIAGFAIRGPIGVILPNAVLASYFFIQQRFKDFFIWSLVAVLVAAALWSLQLGLAWYQGGQSFVADVVRMQVMERMNLQEYEPFYYYFTSSLGNFAPTFPLFVLVCACLLWKRKTLTTAPDIKLLLSLLMWVLLIIGGLSIPHTKKVRYLMPMLPALCAVVAYPIAFAVFPRLRRFLINSISVYPGFLLALLFYSLHFTKLKQFELAPYSQSALLLLVLLQAIVATATFWPRLNAYRVHTSLIAAAASSWVTWSLFAAPNLEKMHDTTQFVQSVETIRASAPAPLAFFQIGQDGMAIKYVASLNYTELPYFTMDANELASLPKPIYLLVEKGKEKPIADNTTVQPEELFSGQFDKTELILFILRQ